VEGLEENLLCLPGVVKGLERGDVRDTLAADIMGGVVTREVSGRLGGMYYEIGPQGDMIIERLKGNIVVKQNDVWRRVLSNDENLSGYDVVAASRIEKVRK
jgi:hypothetical protein